MKRKRLIRALAGAAAALAMATTVSTPNAWAAGGLSDAEYAAVVKEVYATGKATAEQRRAILSRPELAANVIDPTSAKADYELPGYLPDPLERSKEVARGRTSQAGGGVETTLTAYANRTRSVDRYVVYETFYHHKIVNYHFKVSWSYNGSVVVGTPARSTWVDASGGAPGIRNNGIISDGSYRNYNSRGVYAWTLPLQGQWEQCLASLGCGQMVGNPYVTFGVYFDGTYHYTFNHK